MPNKIACEASDLMDQLRGGGSLTVALVHGFQIFCLPYYGLYGFHHLLTSWLATYAVMIFFIVSGFMIYFSIRRHWSGNSFRIGSFFAARALRIYPPMLASLLLCAAVFGVMWLFEIHGYNGFRLGGELFMARDRMEFETDRIISTLTLSYNIVPGSTPPLSINGPLWSLSYEWWFYMLAMLATFAWSCRRIWAWALVASVIVLFSLSPSGALLWVLLAVWLSGFLLGHLYREQFLWHRFFLPITGLVVCLLIGGALLVGRERTIDLFIEPLQRHGTPAHLTMMFVSLFLTTVIGMMLRYRLRIPLLRMLIRPAKYSYTLYVIHYPLLLLLFGLLYPWLHELNSAGISLLVMMPALLMIILVASRIASVVEDRIMIRKSLSRLWNMFSGGCRHPGETSVASCEQVDDR